MQPDGVRDEDAIVRDRLESLTMDEDFGVDLDQVRAFLADKKQRRRARVDKRFAQATRDAQLSVESAVAGLKVVGMANRCVSS